MFYFHICKCLEKEKASTTIRILKMDISTQRTNIILLPRKVNNSYMDCLKDESNKSESRALLLRDLNSLGRS
jgi:hypothetical protein